MGHNSNRVCPVERAGGLDNSVRRWVQNPRKKVQPYLTEGMAVLDMGCGPGFFTIEMAQLVGQSGRIYAADMQDGMLAKIREKIKGTALEQRITLHKCMENRIGLATTVDFVFAFYMVHEIPDQQAFFTEIASIVKPNGRVYIEEPPFHVSNTAFEAMISKAEHAGFTAIARPKVLLGNAVLLKKG